MKEKNHTPLLLKILAYISLIFSIAGGVFGITVWDFKFNILLSAAVIFFGLILFAVLYAFGENIKLISEIKELLKKEPK